MIIIIVQASGGNTIMDVLLPHASMVVDPRIIDGWSGNYSFSVNGRILTITRTDEDEDEDEDRCLPGWYKKGWHCKFYLRAYLPTETIPDFTSTVYT